MDFYDDLSPFYHLIFSNWDESIRRQGEQLNNVIQTRWPGCRKVLDVSCGIGTQAIALAAQGYAVTASDISKKEIERARTEAELRGLDIGFSVADMRAAYSGHGAGFDLVVSCDNSIPHLLTDDDLLLAFRQFHACLRPGGGCLISVRDYDNEEKGANLVKHYGVRVENSKRYMLFQVRNFHGDRYDLSFFVVEEDLRTGQVTTRVMRSKYYAVSTGRLGELMREAGFIGVTRIDDDFYQPLLVGTRPDTVLTGAAR